MMIRSGVCPSRSASRLTAAKRLTAPIRAENEPKTASPTRRWPTDCVDALCRERLGRRYYRPKFLGVKDYGGGVKALNLCPSTPNCIATSEAANDDFHYAPPLLYNPEEGRGKKNPVSQSQAMEELASVVSKVEPDNFTPKIIEQRDDYLYAEFQSPTFGFIDDVEFWFPADKPGTLEYRSASRVGESDGNINRKRIRAIRQELEKFGWISAGF